MEMVTKTTLKKYKACFIYISRQIHSQLVKNGKTF